MKTLQKTFPKLKILNQKEEKLFQLGETTLFNNFQGIEKLDIKSIDKILRKEEKSKEMVFFKV